MQNSLPPFKAVLFDWDNTLADNWHCVLHSINHVLALFNHPTWSEEEGHKRIRKSSRDLFTELFGAENLQKASDAFYKHFEQNHVDVLRPMADAEALLILLKKQGIQTGIVSNKKGDYLRKEVAHLGWSSYFDVIVGANDAKKDKPHPEPVLLAVAKLNEQKTEPLDLKQILFVGDTETDIESAQLSGVIPIFVHTEKMYHIEKNFLNKDDILQFNELNGFYHALKAHF